MGCILATLKIKGLMMILKILKIHTHVDSLETCICVCMYDIYIYIYLLCIDLSGTDVAKFFQVNWDVQLPSTYRHYKNSGLFHQ